jgi:hypothetical protein
MENQGKSGKNGNRNSMKQNSKEYEVYKNIDFFNRYEKLSKRLSI